MYTYIYKGARVVKHGNRAATSKSGTADVLEALGARLEIPAASVGKVLQESGFVLRLRPKAVSKLETPDVASHTFIMLSHICLDRVLLNRATQSALMPPVQA